MDILLSAGVKVNTKDFEGNTLLHLAAKMNDNKLIKFLLSNANVYISLTNDKSETAKSICI